MDELRDQGTGEFSSEAPNLNARGGNTLDFSVNGTNQTSGRIRATLDNNSLPLQEPTGEYKKALIANGKFEVMGCLGRGAGGEVLLARHISMGRLVAIKVHHANLSPPAKVRFQREAQMLGSIPTHKNVVHAYDHASMQVNTDDGGKEERQYIVFEYLPGCRDLQKIVAEDTSLSIEQALKIMVGTASGVQALHNSGIIHRDIKPANILVTSDGEPKITDLGISFIQDSTNPGRGDITGEHSIFGTPDYMSPDHTWGSTDARSDVYSLGVTLYTLLNGQPPFHNRDDFHKLRAQVEEDFPELDSTIPSVIKDIIKKATAKNPQDRYQTAEEFGNACRQALAGTNVVVNLPSPESGLNYLRIAKGVAGLSAGIALAITFLIFSVKRDGGTDTDKGVSSTEVDSTPTTKILTASHTLGAGLEQNAQVPEKNSMFSLESANDGSRVLHLFSGTKAELLLKENVDFALHQTSKPNCIGCTAKLNHKDHLPQLQELFGDYIPSHIVPPDGSSEKIGVTVYCFVDIDTGKSFVKFSYPNIQGGEVDQYVYRDPDSVTLFRNPADYDHFGDSLKPSVMFGSEDWPTNIHCAGFVKSFPAPSNPSQPSQVVFGDQSISSVTGKFGATLSDMQEKVKTVTRIASSASTTK